MKRFALNAIKLAFAVTALVALLSLPARELAPQLTLLHIGLYLAVGFVALVLLAICSLQFTQFVLRSGGTDPQWFWFAGEPPGLQRLRTDAAAPMRQETRDAHTRHTRCPRER